MQVYAMVFGGISYGLEEAFYYISYKMQTHFKEKFKPENFYAYGKCYIKILHDFSESICN
jgi:hypothetical protein